MPRAQLRNARERRSEAMPVVLDGEGDCARFESQLDAGMSSPSVPADVVQCLACRSIDRILDSFGQPAVHWKRRPRKYDVHIFMQTDGLRETFQRRGQAEVRQFRRIQV